MCTPGDGTLRLFDLSGGKELHVYKSTAGVVASFTKNGKNIAALSNGTINLLRLETQSIDVTDKAKEFYVKTESLQDSSLTRYKAARPGESDKNKLEIVIPFGHQRPINYSLFSNDYKLVLTSDNEKTIVWDVRSGKPLHYFDIPVINSIIRLPGLPVESTIKPIFSPDGKYIVNARDSAVFVWSLTTGKLFQKINQRYRVKKILFNDIFSQLLVMSDMAGKFTPDTLSIWNIINAQNVGNIFTEKLPATPKDKKNTDCGECNSGNISYCFMRDVCLNGPGNQILVAYENCVRSFDSRTFQLTSKTCFNQPLKSQGKVAFIGNDHVMDYDDQGEMFFKISNGEFIGEVKEQKWEQLLPAHCMISPDEKYFISYDEDTVRFVSLQPAQPSTKIKGDSIKEIAFNTTGSAFIIYFEHKKPDVYSYPSLLKKSNFTGNDFDGLNKLTVITQNRIVEPEYYRENKKQILNNSLNTDSLSKDNVRLKYVFDKVNVSVKKMQLNITQMISNTSTSAFVIKPEDGREISRLESLVSRSLTSSVSPVFYNEKSGVLSVSNEGKFNFYAVASGKLIYSINFDNKSVTGEFSPDGTYFAILKQLSGEIELWNIKEKKLDRTIHDTTGIASMSFSADGKFILITRAYTVRKFSIETGKLQWLQYNVTSLRENKDGSKACYTAPKDGSIHIKDMNNNKEVFSMPAMGGNSQNNYTLATKILMLGNNNALIAWDIHRFAFIPDINTGKRSYTIEDIKKEGFNDVVVSPDESYALIKSDNGIARVVQLQTGKEIFDAQLTGYSLIDKNNASFSGDSKRLLLKTHDTITIYNTSTGEPLKAFLIDGDIQQINYLGDKIVTYDKGQVKFYKISTGKKWFTFVVFIDGSYVFMLPDGKYFGGKEAIKRIGFVTGLNYFSFQQFDVQNNRPDIVLGALGNTDTSLLSAYWRAYLKRIKKLGVDTGFAKADYRVPEADFANRDSIQLEQLNDKLTLNIKSVDSTYQLDRFNIWINDVPLYGQRGIRIHKQKNNSFDTGLTVTLSQGRNKIETSVTNAGGRESYRLPLYVSYQPATPTAEKIYFVGIGINEFENTKYNLQWSVKDIKNLADSFKAKYGNTITIDTFFNKEVTIENIVGLKNKLLKSDVNDKVIVAYSGHGLLNRQYDYYLSTYNVNFDKPEENGLLYDELENLLDNIPARKKLMLIDACHSGEVDKDELKKMIQTQALLDNTKGVIIFADSANKRMGMKNSFELMQELFVNLGISTGATVISAAAGTQFALEKGDLKNGVFTYSILEAMKKNKTLTVNKLKQYVNNRVPELTNGLQQPTSRTENIDIDWNVW